MPRPKPSKVWCVKFNKSIIDVRAEGLCDKKCIEPTKDGRINCNHLQIKNMTTRQKLGAIIKLDKVLSQEGGKMKLIYVAGKYTGKTYSEIDDNIRIAEAASIKLLRLGWAVITPHKNTAHYERYEDENLTYETWMNVDFEILKRCDAIFLMTDWELSKGACKEKEVALESDLPIFFEKHGIPRPEDLKKEEE